MGISREGHRETCRATVREAFQRKGRSCGLQADSCAPAKRGLGYMSIRDAR